MTGKPGVGPEGDADEKRVQARVETELECRILTKEETAGGYVRDLSHGGALLMARTGLVSKGDTLSLELPLPGVLAPISVMCEVVRVVPGPDWSRYGLRFVIVEPSQRQQLREYVDGVLVNSSSRARKHARLYRRVQVVCQTEEQFRAVLINISKGGLAIHCQLPLVVDEEVAVQIRADRRSAVLDLSGNVVHSRSVAKDLFHVGLRFKPLPADKQFELDRVLKKLLSGEPMGPV